MMFRIVRVIAARLGYWTQFLGLRVRGYIAALFLPNANNISCVCSSIVHHQDQH